MLIKSLTLLNYRNYIKETFTFHERFNLIIGNNGQGKTNLLEAINVLCKFTPFKKLSFEELICLNSSETRLKGEIQNNGNLNEVNIQISRKRKIIKFNNKILYKTRKYSNLTKTVTFLPKDTNLINGSSTNRRNYFDNLIADSHIEHYSDITNYYKTLKQRNSLLHNYSNKNSSTLEIWNYKLAELSHKIANRRINYIKSIQPLIQNNYNTISGKDRIIELIYKHSFEHTSNYEQDLIQALTKNMDIDLKRHTTNVGAHRDKINIFLNCKDSSKYASQGEAKSLVLSLKLSEVEISRQNTGQEPILLLDDISSELDDERKRYLTNYLNQYKGQLFVTTTNYEPEFTRKADKIYKIDSGRIIN